MELLDDDLEALRESANNGRQARSIGCGEFSLTDVSVASSSP
jgi:hypothetical protein